MTARINDLSPQKAARIAGILYLAIIAGGIMIAVAIESVNLLNHFAPLDLLAADGLSAFTEQQLQALAYSSLEFFSSGFAISLTFFGFFALLAGILIFRSGFLPQILGVLMTVAGLCYLINSFLVFVVPAFAAQLFPYILMPCIVAELSFALWLLVMGVNLSKFDGAA